MEQQELMSLLGSQFGLSRRKLTQDIVVHTRAFSLTSRALPLLMFLPIPVFLAIRRPDADVAGNEVLLMIGVLALVGFVCYSMLFFLIRHYVRSARYRLEAVKRAAVQWESGIVSLIKEGAHEIDREGAVAVLEIVEDALDEVRHATLSYPFDVYRDTDEADRIVDEGKKSIRRVLGMRDPQAHNALDNGNEKWLA